MATELRAIRSLAPTRIDLAGGTVDLWPLYLFLKSPTTINLGIDLFAETDLAENTSGKVILKSTDQDSEMALTWSELLDAEAPPSLALHLKLTRFFAREKRRADALDRRLGLTISTRAKSPAGAGLGGSSTLAASMVGALATWSRGKVDIERDGEKLVEVIRDIETTVIQVPAGVQDYYGAVFGGLQSLRWGTGSHDRVWLHRDLIPELEKRLILFYSGQSRNSGINNWALFKMFIDRQGDVRKRFQSIVDATLLLESALARKDWDEVGTAIAAEWETRRGLASGISTPEIDRAFEVARHEGATAGKICGAGGGGCFFLYVPSGEARARTRIIDQVTALGIRNLPFSAVSHGLKIQVSRA